MSAVFTAESRTAAGETMRNFARDVDDVHNIRPVYRNTSDLVLQRDAG